MPKNKQISFEEKLKELEEIASKLDEENCSLEESLKLFERGVLLSRELESELNEAKLKVKKLIDSTEKDITDKFFKDEMINYKTDV
jgi:exodeoxyribonuclease VII small subunit